MNIRGKNILLRAIEVEDLEILHAWGNDPDLQHSMGIIRFPSSKEFHRRWFDKVTCDESSQRWIIQTTSGKIIGLSSIINIDWRNRRAWHGIMIGDKESQNSFYGVDSVFTTMKYAFEELNFERLDGGVIEYNEKSKNLYCSKILGWEIEGVRKNYFFHNGRYWNEIMIGITRKRFIEIVRKNARIFSIRKK
jgi:RimJ/RimL family protein N-acetyltransferase